MAGWGKAEFDQFYRSYPERWGVPAGRPPIVLGYHWRPILHWQRVDYAPRLAQVLGLVPGNTVVIIGCGFNATGAGLADLGVAVVGTDTSSYVQAQKVATEEAEIRAAISAAGLNPDTDKIIGPSGQADLDPLDYLLEGGKLTPAPRGKGVIMAEDMSSRPSRNTIRNALGGTVRYCVTEELLNSVPDAEALQICNLLAQFASENGATIVHMLSPLQVVALQAPTLNWKTYAGWRSFLNANGFSAQRVIPTVTADAQGMTLPASEPAGRVVAYAGLI